MSKGRLVQLLRHWLFTGMTIASFTQLACARASVDAASARSWLSVTPELSLAADAAVVISPEVANCSSSDAASFFLGISSESIGRKIEDETLPDLLSEESANSLALPMPEEIACEAESKSPGEKQAPAEKFIFGSKATTRFNYTLCWRQAPVITCSHRAMRNYLQQELKAGQCGAQGVQASDKQYILDAVKSFDKGRSCQGVPGAQVDLCQFYREARVRAQEAIKAGKYKIPENRVRQLVAAMIANSEIVGISEDVREEVHSALISAVLVAQQKFHPRQIHVIAPHLLRASILSCRKHRWERKVSDDLILRTSGGGDEMGIGTHDYQPGEVGAPAEGRELPGDESCPIIHGRPSCS